MFEKERPKGDYCLTYFSSVVCSTENKFRGAIVTRADVRHVRFVRNQDLRAAEITELENSAVGVQEKVLRLDVTMADALGVDVRKCSEQLVDVQLNFQNRHGDLHLVEKAGCSIDRLGNKLLNQVEVNLVSLQPKSAIVHGMLVKGRADNLRVHRWSSRRPSVVRCSGGGQFA